MKEEDRGLHNWRNLFRKPKFDDWVVLALMCCIGYLTWAYGRDVSGLQLVLEECKSQLIHVVEQDPIVNGMWQN